MPIIPATKEAEIRKIMALGQPEEKVSKTPSQQISWLWWPVTVIPATWEA
jgi:hypothetical protein